MMTLLLSIDLMGADATIDALAALGRQIPFAVSKALNATANAGQTAVREKLPSIMTLRQQQFVERTIYRKPGDDFATKAKLEAAVRIHPERNQLAKFIRGGTKSPSEGKVVAIPAEARRTKKGVVPKSLWIKNLQFNQWQSPTLSSEDAARALKSGAKQRTGARGRKGEPVLVGLQKTWMTRDGIWQRVGKDVRLLYRFKREVRIPAILPMDDVIEQTVLRVWDEQLLEAIEYAIATAR